MSENMAETPKKSPDRSAINEIFEWVETFCIALCAVVVIFTFLCRFVTVDGNSMNQTLHNMDRLIISHINYTPKTGDIVVLQDLQENFSGPIIKRVIATGGETVDIDFDSWKVTVTDKDGNTRVLDEPYVNFIDGVGMYQPSPVYYPHAVTSYPHTVAENSVFVMGDNRNNSLDSRFVGDIDKRMILGKAFVRIFQFNKIGFMK